MHLVCTLLIIFDFKDISTSSAYLLKDSWEPLFLTPWDKKNYSRMEQEPNPNREPELSEPLFPLSFLFIFVCSKKAGKTTKMFCPYRTPKIPGKEGKKHSKRQGILPGEKKHKSIPYRVNGHGGFRSQSAADPLWWPPQNPWKADRRYCDSISKHANPASTFELSQCRRCKGSLPGTRRDFGCPPAVCPPERPRPFTHYTEKVYQINSKTISVR